MIPRKHFDHTELMQLGKMRLLLTSHSKEAKVTTRPILHLFVVDDEPVIAATTVTILQTKGYAARLFTNPIEALAAGLHAPPDLLITDMNMPSLSGLELAILMKAQHPKLQILLLSGDPASIDLVVQARSRGHNLTLFMKPISPAELLMQVDEIMIH